MEATSAASVSLLLGLTVLSALVDPSHSLNCHSSKKFSGNRVYSTCSDLPVLGAELHYTYDAANSSLSIAFTAATAPGGAWVAWAINPTNSGMVGSQALMALKLADGSVVAKTYAISSYRNIAESKLSFDAWDLAAEASEGTMTIFASVKVPVNAASVNQVWQVGGAVDSTGHPSIHPMEQDNMRSMSTLKLATSSSSENTVAPAPAHSAAVSYFQPSVYGLVLGLTVLIGSIIMSL